MRWRYRPARPSPRPRLSGDPAAWPDDPLRERRRSHVPGGADVAAVAPGELLTDPVGVPPA
ncbi:hypothetical protein [Actinomadura hallensis]|uniref:hypothetical protein n=1 Tax=Actinomadura hallensis TaxID=337895 RepID=UPI00163A20B9|nr:hypothetical protein [Actinomadura hallensis]MDA8368416.1 hypothetical protein [Nocardiopsaceae bacterium]